MERKFKIGDLVVHKADSNAFKQVMLVVGIGSMTTVGETQNQVLVSFMLNGQPVNSHLCEALLKLKGERD
jgi:hypothetical protein